MKIHSEVASRSNPMSAVAPDRVGRSAVVCVALVASLGVLPWLGGSIFADEGATLYSARLPWSDLWAQSQYVDLVLLPYYLLIHFWILVSGNVAWVRALSLLAFFGTIVVIGWTGLRIAGRWCGIIASVLTATSTLLVEKSLNARPYTLSTFLVTLCALYLFKWLDDSRTRWFWIFTILALFATIMQLFSLLAPVAMLLGVLLVRPELIAQRLRALRAPVVLLAVASGAWVVACAREVGQVNWIGYESLDSRLLAEVRGPAIGEAYDFVLFVVVVVVLTKLAIVSNRDGRGIIIKRVRQDRDILGLMVGWVVVPTVVLALVSFIHPIYSVRYVAASAPGAALLVAFICQQAFPTTLGQLRNSDQTANRKLRSRMMAIFGVAAAVLLAIGYVGSASAQQEDLQSPALYAAQHAQNGDVIALPDHAITSAIDYYLASGKWPIPLWPQVGVRQRYIEGFDLSLDPPICLPHRVWLVLDDSVSVTGFQRVLKQNGYFVSGYKQFRGSAVVVYDSTSPTSGVLVPSSGATLRGKDAVLDASDWNSNGAEISKVQFVLGGGSHSEKVIGRATFTGVGAVFLWNTTKVPNGTYSIRSRATSTDGKSGCGAAITVKVDN